LTVELIFVLFLLCFGVYVIYNTWTFQRAVLLTETRWVLFALYNVILNIFAIAPFLSLRDTNESLLSSIVIASIDLSAGSIACAVLLPRVLQQFKISKGSKPSGTKTHREAAGSIQTGVKSKRRESRTPEEELSRKLTDPRPRDMSMIELQAVEQQVLPSYRPASPSSSDNSRGFDQAEIESPSIRLASSLQLTPSRESLRVSPSKNQRESLQVSPSKNQRESLQWSENPIKEEREKEELENLNQD